VNRPHDFKAEAIVLKKTRLKEADRILTLYTLEHGKIQAVARSVSKSQSRLAGHLEILTHTAVNLSYGRGKLPIITGSQTIDAFLPVRNSLELTSYGLYFSELVSQFTEEEEPHPAVFKLLIESLASLGDEPMSELLARFFELKLLYELGFKPELRKCSACEGALEPDKLALAPASGGVVCPLCSARFGVSMPVSVNCLKALRFIQENDYLSATHLKISSAISREASSLLRRYICFLLEKDIKSASWLDYLNCQ